MEQSNQQVQGQVQNQQTPVSNQLPNANPWKIISIIFIVLLFGGGLSFAGFYLGQKQNNPGQNGGTPTQGQEVSPTLGQANNNLPTVLPTQGEVDNDPQVKFFVPPIKVAKMGLLTIITNNKLVQEGPGPDLSTFDFEGNADYYKIGIMKDPVYNGKELYLADIRNMPGFFSNQKQENILRFIKDGNKFIVLDNNSNLLLDSTLTMPSNMAIDKTLTIASLKHNPGIVFSYKGSDIIFSGWSYTFSPTNGMKKIGIFGGKDFYAEDFTLSGAPTFKEIGKNRKYYLKNPDMTFGEYELSDDYINKNPQKYTPVGDNAFLPVPSNFQIAWTDSVNLMTDPKSGGDMVYYNQYNSEVTIPGGTGKITYYDKNIDLKNDLVKIGSNPAGEEFFGLKDKNHIIYTDFYKNRNDYSDFTKKMSFNEFVSQRPMFFWKDLFGDYHALFRGDFEIAAGIAKPAVYLYPEKEMEVSVKIDKTLYNVLTIPEIGTGWKVLAKPNGEISYNGKVFDYLFYEGDKKGFIFEGNRADIVKKENVTSYLTKKLYSLGLNNKETAQFIEYWEPRMRTSNFYKVAFMGTEELQREVPLYVTPKPETLIRVLMKFEGVNTGVEKINLGGIIPERKGFTVVEWGGMK